MDKTTLNLYMERLESLPTLKKGENNELAYKIRAGREAAVKLPRARSEKSRELLETVIREGEEARQLMIEGNLRLVLSKAMKMYVDEIDMEDFINEGNLTLIDVVDKYDPDKGVSFSSYAVPALKATFIRMIKTRNIVTVSATAARELHQINSAEKQYVEDNRKQPTFEELSEITGYSINKIALLKNFSTRTESLNREVEDNLTLSDVIASPIKDEGMSDGLWNLLLTLPERHRNVIKGLYGFNTGHVETNAKIKEANDISSNRVRTIEAESIAMIKHPSRYLMMRDIIS